jgi:hypothetical protein
MLASPIERAVEILRAWFAAITPVELLQLRMDPPHAVLGIGDGALLDVVPGGAIDALVAVSGADTPLLSVELRHLGGAVARTGEGHGALATLEGDFALFAVGIAPHAAAVVDPHDLFRANHAIAPID